MLCKAPKYSLRSDRWPGHRSWWSGWFIMWFSFRSHSRSTKSCTCSELSGEGRTFFLYIYFNFFTTGQPWRLYQDEGGGGKLKVPGEIKRSRGGRWSWTLKLAQKRSWVGRWNWSAKVGLLWLRVVPQQQCNGHCPCDCPSTAVKTAITRCTSRWAMARGHCLNTSIVLAAVHGLSGLFRAVSAVEPSLFHPLCPPPPPSLTLISHLARFCGCKVKWSGETYHKMHICWTRSADLSF